MKIDGSCHCGNVSYEAEVDPLQVIICHCTDSQTLSGSAYRTVVPALGDSFKLLSGKPKTYIKTAENGVKRAQVFCPDCGSPIYAGPVEGGSSMIGIRVGTCRQRGLLTPQKQYWSHSAQPWAQNLAITAIVKQE
jgi:hypothetical protein